MNIDGNVVVTPDNLREVVQEVVSNMKFPDVHTHLFPPTAGKLWLSGIVELLRYHYAYREHLAWRRDLSPTEFWELPEREQADQVWKTHFAHTGRDDILTLPLSEGMRAIITILEAFGIDPNASTIDEAVNFFSRQDPYAHTSKVLELAGVSSVIGTNNPFDHAEREFYLSRPEWHPAFRAALRLDDLVLDPVKACRTLRDLGYKFAQESITTQSEFAIRDFLRQWVSPENCFLPEVTYVGISFPPDFPWLNPLDLRVKMLEKVIIPFCEEYGLSLFLMPEPVRQLEPAMKNAGDFLGKMDPVAFGHFAGKYPEVDIWVSPLNFASQYEMSALSCVLPHVKPWGTWWYNHQPGLTRQLSNMRIEMNGSNSFPFNSDARVLEHLISKWQHFREELKVVMIEQFGRIVSTSYEIRKSDIESWLRTIFDERRIRRDEWSSVLSSTYEA